MRLWPAATLLERGRDAPARRALIEGLGQLDADVVIVDVADAHRDDLWNFFAAGAERLLVSTGDRAALEATYAFLQEAAMRAERRHGAGAREVLARFTGGLVGNVAAAAEEAESFHAFARLVRGELGIPLTALGCLRQSARIVQSIAAKKPLCARRGIDDEVRAFNQIAELVVADRDDAAPDCALDGDAPVLEPARLPSRPRPLPAKIPALRGRLGGHLRDSPASRTRSACATSPRAARPSNRRSPCGSATPACSTSISSTIASRSRWW